MFKTAGKKSKSLIIIETQKLMNHFSKYCGKGVWIFAFLFWGRDVKAHYNGYNVILNLI